MKSIRSFISFDFTKCFFFSDYYKSLYSYCSLLKKYLKYLYKIERSRNWKVKNIICITNQNKFLSKKTNKNKLNKIVNSKNKIYRKKTSCVNCNRRTLVFQSKKNFSIILYINITTVKWIWFITTPWFHNACFQFTTTRMI